MINIFKSKISSAYVFSNAFPSYSIKARVLPMIFVDPHDLHWGPHLSDLHSSLGSLEHALSQSGPLQGLALSRHGACLCPESCRICFSSPPAGSLLTCRYLSEAFPDHLSYFTIFPQHSLTQWTASGLFFFSLGLFTS